MPASLSEEEMESQIELEADQYIPYDLDEVNLDFSVIGPNKRNSSLIDVQLAASRRENIDDRVAVLDLAGLKAQIAERLEAEYAGASRAVMKRGLLDQLDSMVDFDLPPTLVETEAGQIAHSREEAALSDGDAVTWRDI